MTATRAVRRAFVKFGLTGFDQGLSSLSNVIASILAARLLPASQFGVFGIVVASYLVCLMLIRAFAGDGLLATAGHGTESRSISVAVWNALGAGVVASVLLALGALLLRGQLGSALAVLAIAMPGLALQDVGRYVGFQRSKPGIALLSDGVWLLLMLAAVPFAAAAPSAWLVTALWAGSGVVAGLTPLRWLRVRRLSAAEYREWRAEHGRSIVSIFFDQLSVSASQQGAVYLIAALVGLLGNAAYRGAQVILGPMNVFTMGLNVVAVPHLRRRWLRYPDRLASRAAAIGLSAAVVVTIITQSLAFLPDPIGRLVLGETWRLSHPLLPWLGLLFTGQSLNFAAIAGLRVMGRADRGLWVRLGVVPVTLTAVGIAAASSGVLAVVITQSACSLAAGIAWWTTFLTTARSESRRRGGGAAAAVSTLNLGAES